MLDRHQKSEVQEKQQNGELMKNLLANNQQKNARSFFIFIFHHKT